jgi:hypothetical protein
MTAFGKIKKWNTDRNLLTYNHKNEVSFIVEELIEGTIDIKSIKARKISKIFTWIILKIPGAKATKHMMVDAFADIIVFATGAIYKLGYDTDKVMKEVQKELDDRTGKLIDGKFIKDIKEDRYIADFTNCKLK